MCKAFSCIVLKNREVIWEFGVDSHEDILKLRPGLKDNTDIQENMMFARCEYSPRNGSYLKPDKWVFHLDESIRPTWFDDICKKRVKTAWGEWKRQLDKILIKKPIIHPFKMNPPEVTRRHITLVEEWASVRDSVGDSVRASVRDSVGDSVWDSVRDSMWVSVWDSVRVSVWDSVRASVWASVGASVRDSVWDSVRDSVGAYIGSFFNLSRNKWKYTENIKIDGYPFQSVVKLWELGIVPSFDGKKWRFHGGKDAGTLWEGEVKG